MLSPIEKSFEPNPEMHKLYNAIYEDYKRVGAFAGDLAKS